MRKIFFLLFVVGAVTIPGHVFAHVRINEVAWMGDAISSSNEWIELYNGSSSPVDLSGWKLSASDGSPSISLAGNIPGQGYFLLERTDDNSVSDISAGVIYSGALSNSGEELLLQNSSDASVQTIDASAGWPAGESTKRETMSWSDGKWITTMPTPGLENSHADLSEDKGSSDDPLSSASTSSSTAGNDESSDGKISTHASSVPLSTEDAPVTIYVDAGRDRAGVSGAPIRFIGKAFDEDGNDAQNATYLWSFGDGSSAEGEVEDHVYSFPGIYEVVLHAVSGGSKAVDRTTVNISQLELQISNVRSGKDGYIALENQSKKEINLGGYQLETQTGRFTFPIDTILAGSSTVRFANDLTALSPSNVYDVTLKLPDGDVVASSSVIEKRSTIATKLSDSISKLGKLQLVLAKKQETESKIKKMNVPIKKSGEVHIEQTANTERPSEKKDAINQTASAKDSIVVVSKPISFWDRVLHFFFTNPF